MPDEPLQQPAPAVPHPSGEHPSGEGRGERKVEEIAGKLDIGLPRTKEPLPAKIIGLLMVLGGLSVAGTFLTDVILANTGIVLDFVRLAVGVALAVLGYGIIRRRLLALWGLGAFAVLVAFYNPVSLVLTVPIVAYLVSIRRFFRPGALLGRLLPRYRA